MRLVWGCPTRRGHEGTPGGDPAGAGGRGQGWRRAGRGWRGGGGACSRPPPRRRSAGRAPAPSPQCRRGAVRAGPGWAGLCGAAPGMAEKKQPVDLGLLEEDDEFEEFPAEDWTGLDEDEDAHVWEDNWDDDNVEDDFSNQLRAELEKHGYKMETS
uniref:26S proteasome complex subunit SEM1 n=2 Tax=Anas platyrhynchos TaxID=8839 RepID=A0A493TD91_ANAPP